MPRPRIYLNAAQKQAAYRARNGHRIVTRQSLLSVHQPTLASQVIDSVAFVSPTDSKGRRVCPNKGAGVEPRPLAERIAAVKNRATPRLWAAEEIRPIIPESLADHMASRDAESRKIAAALTRKVRRFLRTNPDARAIRDFLSHGRYIDWQIRGLDDSDSPEKRHELVLEAVSDFYGGVISVCEHGQTWLEPCDLCDRDIGAVNIEAQRDANVLLAKLGMSKWAESSKFEMGVGTTATNGRLDKIEHAHQRDTLIGGKKVTPKSQRINLNTGRRQAGAKYGPDEFEKGDRQSGGQATSRPDPNYAGTRSAKDVGSSAAARPLHENPHGEALDNRELPKKLQRKINAGETDANEEN